MGMERGVKETPSDADGGERLHHFKIAGGRSPSQAQTFEVNEQGNTARDRSEQKQCGKCGTRMRLGGSGPERTGIQLAVDQED